MGFNSLRRSRAAALTTAAATVTAMLALTAPTAANADTKPASSSIPTTVSSDSLPTAQLANGVGWAQAVLGGNVYVGGSFTGALAPGATSGAVTRSNLMSYNLTTGALNSFAPTLNGQVVALAASPDGRTLYLGGAFTTVNGTARNHLAAIDTTTGALTSWNPNVNSAVNAIQATASTVFFGGQFTSVGGTARNRAAAVSASSGALTSFAPSGLDNSVRAMALGPDGSKVALGGFFSTIDGSSGSGFGIVDAATGLNLMNTPVRTVVNDGSTTSAIFGMSSDGTNVYGNGYYSQTDPLRTGNLEGTFAVNWNTGATSWIEECHGDEFGSAVLNGVVYVAGHPHYCYDIDGGYPQQQLPGASSPTYQRTIAFTTAATGRVKPNTLLQPRYYDRTGTPAPSLLDWFPTLSPGTFTGASQASYNIISSGNYLLEVGEFPRVNGGAQYGTARFALPTIAPNADGPQVSGSSWPIYASTLTSGRPRISWLANYDRDNENLTYTLKRGSTTIYTTTAASRVWYQRPTLSFTDTGATPGSTYSYSVTATDAFGNSRTSATLSYTVPATSQSAYAQQVVGDGATSLWRLGEASGTAIKDTAGATPATGFGGVTLGTAGAISGDTDTAATFDGTAGTTIASNGQVNPTDTFSVESWFKTTAASGGEIIGAGDYQTVTTTTSTFNGQTVTRTSDSRNHDREIATTADGHVTFTVNPGAVDTITSANGGYNDGQWHQAVATLSSAGQVLYVDGQQVASNSSVTRAMGLELYWRIGGDTGYNTAPPTPGQPSAPVNNYFTGSIDEPAVYIGKALTAAQVANHYALAGGGAVTTNNPPTASFTAAANGLAVTVDGSKSSDSDGSVASYSWNFGDGSTDTGATPPAHSYTKAGTYTVSLTVTDDKGATGTTSQPVQVTSANAAPTASFTDSESGLAVTVDGSGSSDSDGTVASYAWDFGDGGTATGAKPAAHTYGSTGSYTVKLTVTDDQGTTDSTSRSITVSAPASTTIAKDGFGRTATGSFGPADTGGAYTLTGTASRYSVNGSAAQLSTTAGSTKKAVLGSTSSSDTDVTATYSLSARPVGGSEYLDLIGRQVGSDYYGARVGVLASGAVNIQVDRGGSVTLRSANVSGLTYTAGDTLQIRLQVYGTNGTTVRARVWKAGTTEPTTWQVTTTDTTASLQSAGSVGVGAYLGSAVTNGPIIVSVDDLLAVPTGN